MPHYLVESYLTDSPAAVQESCDRARSLGHGNAEIRYVRTTFVPEDEVVLHIFEAPSIGALDEAGRVAALVYERIVEAVENPAADRKGGIE